MNEIVEGTILFIALMALALAALIIYLVTLLTRIETLLWRLSRALRPEIRRDGQGRPLYERVD